MHPRPMLQSARARLVILTLVHFTVDFYGGLTIPLPEPTLVRHLGVALPRVALLIGMCAIVVNLIQPLSGWLLPKRGMPSLLWAAPLAARCQSCLMMACHAVAKLTSTAPSPR